MLQRTTSNYRIKNYNNKKDKHNPDFQAFQT